MGSSKALLSLIWRMGIAGLTIGLGETDATQLLDATP